MAQMLVDVVAAYLELQKNPHTRRAYQQALRPLVEAHCDRQLSEITPVDLDRWKDALHERGLAEATIASRTKAMKSFWKWCVTRELVSENPARYLKIRSRRINKSAKALSPDVRSAMLHAVEQKREELPRLRDTAIMALIVTYGARSIDIARLTLSRVNLVQGWLVFDRKGHNEDRQPLPPETAQILRAWIEYRLQLDPDPNHNFVFVNVRTRPGQRYQPLQAASIQTMFKRLAKQVCGEMHGPHSARHLRAQELLDAGLPRELVAQILGHSSPETLAYYANQDWERQKRALNAYELGHSPTMKPAIPRGRIVEIAPEFFRKRIG